MSATPISSRELGASYLRQISEDVAINRTLAKRYHFLSTYVECAHVATGSVIDDIIDVLHINEGFDPETVERTLNQFNDADRDAFAMSFFAMCTLERAKEINRGRDLRINSSGFNYDTPRAKLKVAKLNTVRAIKTWSDIRRERAEEILQGSEVLDVGTVLSGNASYLLATPSVGGILHLGEPRHFGRSRYYTVCGLVDPYTGTPNVELEVIRTSSPDHLGTEQSDQA